MSRYVNRGPDPRILGPAGGWIQSRLSFHSDNPPKGLSVPIGSGHIAVTWPPFLSVFIPYAPKRWASFRAGWRWDRNWGRGGYVADVILKLRINNVVRPY